MEAPLFSFDELRSVRNLGPDRPGLRHPKREDGRKANASWDGTRPEVLYFEGLDVRRGSGMEGKRRIHVEGPFRRDERRARASHEIEREEGRRLGQTCAAHEEGADSARCVPRAPRGLSRAARLGIFGAASRDDRIHGRVGQEVLSRHDRHPYHLGHDRGSKRERGPLRPTRGIHN
jgi:hypothetical protein